MFFKTTEIAFWILCSALSLLLALALSCSFFVLCSCIRFTIRPFFFPCMSQKCASTLRLTHPLTHSFAAWVLYNCCVCVTTMICFSCVILFVLSINNQTEGRSKKINKSMLKKEIWLSGSLILISLNLDEVSIDGHVLSLFFSFVHFSPFIYWEYI